MSKLGDYPATFLDQAKQLMQLNKINEALEFYDKAIGSKQLILDLDKNNPSTFYRRATAYLLLGRNELAISDLDTVLKLKQDNTPVIYN